MSDDVHPCAVVNDVSKMQVTPSSAQVIPPPAERVTVSTSAPVPPPAFGHVTVITFDPTVSAIVGTLQLVVPVALPLPPRLFAQVQPVTSLLALAVPASVVSDALAPASNVAADVGAVMVTIVLAVVRMP